MEAADLPGCHGPRLFVERGGMLNRGFLNVVWFGLVRTLGRFGLWKMSDLFEKGSYRSRSAMKVVWVRNCRRFADEPHSPYGNWVRQDG